MKKLALALVLATLAASPALAQAFSKNYGTGNIAPDPKHPMQQFEYRPDRTPRSNSDAGSLSVRATNVGQSAYAQAGPSHSRTFVR